MNNESAEHPQSCEDGGITTLIIDSFYLCVAIAAIALNGFVLVGLAQLSHSSSSKRFLGIRRSVNRGHPRYQLKQMQYSVSVRHSRPDDNVADETTASTGNGSVFNNSKFSGRSFSSIPRSPSCPERLYYAHSPNASFKLEQSNYWLNQLNIGRKKSVRLSPQPKTRLTTALYLVYSLILSDLINACSTAINNIHSFYHPSGAFIQTQNVVFQIEPIGPCTRLILASLLCTSYNAALFSITGLMIDLYMGVVRSMHYREIEKKTLLKLFVVVWTVSFVSGFNQVLFPTFRLSNKTLPIHRRFLTPSEPCDISGDYDNGEFCYSHGSANLNRSGFVTGAILVFCSFSMIFVWGCALFHVRKQSLARTRTMRLANSQRSVSLPMINRVNGVVFALHGRRGSVQTHGILPSISPRCTERRFLRSAFVLLLLVALFSAFYVPSLVLDLCFLVTRKRLDFAPWMYHLVANLPVCASLVNPAIYSLRLYDVRIGLRNFKRRLMAPSDKSFVRRQLQVHQNQTFVSNSLATQLKIKLPPKTHVISGVVHMLPTT